MISYPVGVTPGLYIQVGCLQLPGQFGKIVFNPFEFLASHTLHKVL